MNIAQIETNLQKLMATFNKETFIYDLLLAYGLPKASITRLKKGNLNLSKAEGEISWKKKLLFKEEYKNDLHLTISALKNELKHKQRFVIVTDYKTLLAIDTKTEDKLDIAIKDIPKYYDFFLPWAGMEKAQHANENPADVKAAEKMAKLFDEIKKENPDDTPEFIHGLNVFLSRLLFCFFAEDTRIFEENQFTNAIDSHTQTDGSDLNVYLDKLFEVLNTPEEARKNLSGNLHTFPYVNGGLFEKSIKAPHFTRRSRQAVIDSGELNWSAINPDIFGSMFQAVISADQRGSLGQHYTSVPNIMKVIEPLFLNDLKEAFEKGKNEPRKLNNLLKRISKLKIFDPACGSGNFLIIAYREIRKLEITILKQLQVLQKAVSGFAPAQLELIPKSQLTLAAQFQVELFSRVQLTQFYGIEIDDFAHEIARLALWLVEHQMNVEFFKEFGTTNPTLPLKEAGHIVQGNATRLDWEAVCPKEKDDEIYILGNPPYLGARMQNKEQKADMANVFNGIKEYNNLDYIAAWFYKGANFISNNDSCQFAIVSTNSICQGEQVAILWPHILINNIEIGFAHKPFLWSNSAKNKAAVYCSIIGLRTKSSKPKYIFNEKTKKITNNINAYLIDYKDIYIYKRRKQLSSLPAMVFGSMANDKGGLIVSEKEKKQIEIEYPNSSIFFKKLVGAVEFTNNTYRWCLWISDDKKETALNIPPIKKKIEKVKLSRLQSKRKATNKLANSPHAFGEIRHQEGVSILIPRVTSERREYVQCGFYQDDTIVLDRASVIYGNYSYLFGIISSKIHTIWTRIVSGRLKMDINYAVGITYNNFPFPPISSQRKQEITQCVFRILEEREKHPEKTLAQLYDPDKMPEGLREAHRLNDLAIERCYRSKPFESDEERLEYLFKLYGRMIAEEKEQGTLFAKEKKIRKRKKL